MASTNSPCPEPGSRSPEINAHIWNGHRSIPGKLRVGVLLGKAGIEAWAADIVALLASHPSLTLSGVFLLEGTPEPPPTPRPFKWLEDWSNRTYGLLRSRVALPDGTRSITVRTDRKPITDCDSDVLVWLEARQFTLDCAGLARLGVWSVVLGDPRGPLGSPPYWREVLDQNPVSTVALRTQGAGTAGLRTISESSVATQQGWRFTLNAAEPLAIAGPVLVRRLLDVLEDESALDRAAPATPSPGLASPTSWDTARFIAHQAYRSVSRRVRAHGRPETWFVAVRNTPDRFRSNTARFIPDGFQDVPQPDGISYADPFLLNHEGRDWLLMEEISVSRPQARLVCREMRADGGFGEPSVLLEKPYHLSYPFVIRQGTDLFLLPETSANKSVELYRAAHFPDQWVLEKQLCSNVAVVDTTVAQIEGIWYFFTTSLLGGNETFLFWSNRLDGEWHYHPRNPICSDIRRSRGAGELFFSGGELLRPVQDCSRCYGYAIHLNRINRISTTEYEEEDIETILPDWRTGLGATHTLNSNRNYEVIDGTRFTP